MNRSISILKLEGLLRGILLLLGGIFFAISILLLAALQPQESEFSFAWVYSAIFLIIWFEGVVWWLKQGLKINDSKLEYKEKKIWTRIAIFGQYGGIILTVICIFVFLIFFFSPTLSIFINKIDINSLSFSKEFLSFVYIFGLYVIARNPLKATLHKICSPIIKKINKGMPKCTLNNNGLIIDLNWKNLQDSSKKSLVTIGFEEIDEIRIFSYVEAQTFEDAWITPNIAWKQTRDLIIYAKGKIARPSAYISYGSGGTTIFLKGPNLFYFITIDSEDVSDLINAYNSFKQKRH